MADKLSLLKRYWGYSTFRPLQEQIIDAVLEGHDILALLPTGGGKSLCYQLPALLLDGVCLVVSPLVSLMKDQVQQLKDMHLKAACIVAGMPSSDVTAVLLNAIAGQIKYLYVSPERLRQQMFVQHLRQMKLSLIAVDEAHCISQWGYDFRPPYLQIADIRPYHPQAPVIALTATATRQVAQDIQVKLMMRGARVFRSSFLRSNLAYTVLHREDKLHYLQHYIKGTEGSGIIYVRSRRTTQEVATFLNTCGITAMYYHAGLDSKERDLRQSKWMKGQIRVMVATNAFGMGIDKPDVRFVIHLDIPESVEAYFQEAGRAGRDGLPADVIMLCDDADIKKCERNFATDFPTVKYTRNVYRALCNYYKIPLGAGADARFDFAMEEICSTYRLAPREFFAACRALEREGLIGLPDKEDLSSTVYVPLKKEELYRFQVDHMAMGNLLQNVIRLYPGLFTEAVAIDEGRIASRCMMEAGDVSAMLTQMKEMRVIDYRPRPKKPQLIFLSSRVDESNLFFGDTTQLQHAARTRLDAVEAYVKCDTQCRSKQLLAYFGEECADDCGRCDVCRAQSQSPAEAEQAVVELLSRNRLPVKDLVEILERRGFRKVSDLLRNMLDRGVLSLDEYLRLGLA